MPSIPHTQTPKVASPPPRMKPEKIADVPVNNGQDKAELIRELDPGGSIVEHLVKKSSYVHERLHDLGRIDNEMYDAAERFRKDFERGNLGGRFSTIDLFRSSGGTSGNVSDAVAEARNRVRSALLSLGARQSGKSLSQSCVWFVVGCGDTLEKWALRIRGSGNNMQPGNEENISEGKASGILYGALEKLAFHYGLVNTRSIKERASTLAAQRSRVDTLQEVITMAEISAVGDAKEALTQFTKLLKDKVEKIKNVSR